MKKKTAVSGAVIATAAMMLMGTFAWESISQKALNEKQEEMNPGARLHDDFNGSNKDVYVENFTDPDDVGMPIYARIRFFEYLEIGTGAGKSTDDVPDKKAVSVIDGAKLDDTSTWTLHNPYGTEDVFHDYFEWEQGGQTSYLPTFNKDEEDKTADINGTLEGTTPGDDVHYDDYVDYTDPENASVTEKEIYSHSPLEESEEVQHDVKQTEDATVLTMSEWKTQGCPKGEFWVYDTDGWAYWATAIEPGTASGCLLNGIKETSALYDDYYYGIDVEAQFVTAGEWGPDYNMNFGENGGELTNDALYLLSVASGVKKKIEITSTGNVKTIERDQSLKFKGKILFGDTLVDGETINWTVEDNKSEQTQIDSTGMLKVGTDETSNCLIIKATSAEDPELYAQYVLYVNVPDTYNLEIYPETKNPDGAKYVAVGKTKQMISDLTKNGVTDKNTNILWSISGQSQKDTTISSAGLLKISDKEGHGTEIKIVAKCAEDTSVQSEYTVKVLDHFSYIPYVEVGSTEILTIDSKGWFVLAKQEDNYLIYGNNCYNSFPANPNEFLWSEQLRYLPMDYPEVNFPTLWAVAQETTLSIYEGKDERVGVQAKLFPLSEADFFGTTNGEKAKPEDYTYGGKILITHEEMFPYNALDPNEQRAYYLRNRSTGSKYSEGATIITPQGKLGNADVAGEDYGNNVYYRFAMWVKVEKQQ